LQNKLAARKIDIAIITETKKKVQGTRDLYTMIYVGVPIDMRASAGAAILIKCTWKNILM
jgi:hypothetical protein